MACAHCGADKGHLYDCPESGLGHVAVSAKPAAPSTPEFAPLGKRRLLGLPIVLVVMLLLVHTGWGAFITRVVFAMPLHELGHAVASWLTGAHAVPLLWMTPMSETRGPLFIVMEVALLGLWAWRAKRGQRPLWPVITVASLLCVGLLIPNTARLALVVFAGDVGALVFGSALMAAFLLPDGLPLSRGGLRWGYLTIGAGAYANIATEWFTAWRDVTAINFGRIEGVGLSDPSRLVDLYGWSEQRLVTSYLSLSALCLLALAVVLYLAARRED